MPSLPALALSLACLPALAGGPAPEGRTFHLDAQFHGAGPVGDLRADARGHLGMGFALGVQARIAPRLAVRMRIEQTGFRVKGDPSFLAVVADGLGGHYRGNREILRTWRLGADFQLFLGRSATCGPFLAGGGSLQRAEYRFEWDEQEPGEEGRNGSRVLAERTAPSFTGALGWQWRSGPYVEARAASVVYRSPDRSSLPGPRKGWILMLGFGVRG